MKFEANMVNIGTDSFIAVEEIETISPPESSPIKRMVNTAKDNNTCIELTYGKRCKSVIVLKSGKIILSANTPQTIVQRMSKRNDIAEK